MMMMITTRKPHTGFRLVPTSVTLNDPEHRNRIYFAIFYRTVVEDRLIVSADYPIPLSTFGQNWPSRQRGLSAVAELLVD